MEGRQRTRQFLLGEEADRPPFLPLATDLTARLAQVEPAELFADPHVLTQSFIQAAAVCRFECVVIRPPQDAVADAVRGTDLAAGSTLPVVREGITRLRALMQDRVAIGLLLPGPWWLAHALERAPQPAELGELTGKLLQIAQSLEPPSLDLLTIFEEDPFPPDRAGDLGSALSTFWNAARYFALPSLFLATEAEPGIGGVGATAVSTMRGATAEELLDTGASRAGVPIDVRSSPPLPVLPAGGFWITQGELPADVEVQRLQEIATAAVAAG